MKPMMILGAACMLLFAMPQLAHAEILAIVCTDAFTWTYRIDTAAGTLHADSVSAAAHLHIQYDARVKISESRIEWEKDNSFSLDRYTGILYTHSPAQHGDWTATCRRASGL